MERSGHTLLSGQIVLILGNRILNWLTFPEWGTLPPMVKLVLIRIFLKSLEVATTREARKSYEPTKAKFFTIVT